MFCPRKTRPALCFTRVVGHFEENRFIILKRSMFNVALNTTRNRRSVITKKTRISRSGRPALLAIKIHWLCTLRQPNVPLHRSIHPTAKVCFCWDFTSVYLNWKWNRRLLNLDDDPLLLKFQLHNENIINNLRISNYLCITTIVFVPLFKLNRSWICSMDHFHHVPTLASKGYFNIVLL